MTLCDECDNEGAQRCGGCSSSWYCSKACQKNAWPLHKVLCTSFKDFQDRPKAEWPGEKYTRAIYFHYDEGAPRFVWLRTCTVAGDEYPWLMTFPEALTTINEEEADSEEFPRMTKDEICHNYALARRLPYNIVVSSRDNFLNDGSTHNKASNKIIDFYSRHLHEWRGPMIAHGTDVYDDNPLRREPSYSQDLGPSDLKIIAHWLNTYLYKPHTPPNIKSIQQEFRAVSGVRINCDGDVEVDGRPRYEPMELPAYHRLFNQAATDISKHVQLPIVIQRIPRSVTHWKKRSDTGNTAPWVNRAATFLNRACQPEREETGDLDYIWGFAHADWQGDVGAVMVMRKDKKTLLEEHVDALAEYHEDYLSDFFQEKWESSHQGVEPEMQRSTAWVMQEITKAKFEDFYVDWKSRQSDEAKKQQISPYDV